MQLLTKIQIIILLILTPLNVVSAKSKSKLHDNAIELVESYLFSLNSIESTFTQTDKATASKRIGKLYISKPNKLKIEYYDGDKEVILLNEDIITVYNTALDERNYLANDDLPLSLLAKRNFSLKKEANVHSFSTNASTYNIIFSLKSDKANRNIALKFSKSPMYITEITVGEGDTEITMTFENPKFNTPIVANVFD